MDLDQIRDLLSIVSESDVSEVEVEEDDFRVVVRKNAPSIMMQQPPAQPPQGMPYYYGGYPPQNAPSPQQQAPPQPQPASPTPSAQAQESPGAAGQEAADAPAASPEETGSEAGDGENEELVRAPIVGTFYRRPSPDEDTFVSEGDAVSKGDVLCIIEAMKIMNEIEAEMSGTIVEVLAEDEEPVEFDQPLFVMETG